MREFEKFTEDTAPQASVENLAIHKRQFGFVPGLFQIMAGAPGVLDAYMNIHETFQNTTLSKAEQTVVWMAINVEHECTYCVPAHSALAHMWGIDEELIEALRNEAPIADPRLETLRSFTLDVVRSRGRVSEQRFEEFYDAGFTQQQALEIVLGVAQKVMSNYINHFAKTDFDPAFKKFAWTKRSLADA